MKLILTDNLDRLSRLFISAVSWLSRRSFCRLVTVRSKSWERIKYSYYIFNIEAWVHTPSQLNTLQRLNRPTVTIEAGVVLLQYYTRVSWKGGVKTFTNTHPPWTLSTSRHPPSGKLKKHPHSWKIEKTPPPLDIKHPHPWTFTSTPPLDIPVWRHPHSKGGGDRSRSRTLCIGFQYRDKFKGGGDHPCPPPPPPLDPPLPWESPTPLQRI